ncbi:hypothetical protein HDU81_005974 [Chytriomyces hyalinus]|nr:hypothetical protein HDU81_005974 [Chytriomyces hyalinus]
MSNGSISTSRPIFRDAVSVLDSVLCSHPYRRVLLAVAEKLESLLAGKEGTLKADDKAPLEANLTYINKELANCLGSADQALQFAQGMLRDLGFDETSDMAPLSSLSGGMRTRCTLACAFFMSPDVLLLDEPTNNLDLPSVLWLESMLRGYKGTFLLVTHDRVLQEKVVTSVMLIADQKLKYFPCNYKEFLARKEQEDADQEMMRIKDLNRMSPLVKQQNPDNEWKGARLAGKVLTRMKDGIAKGEYHQADAMQFLAADGSPYDQKQGELGALREKSTNGLLKTQPAERTHRLTRRKLLLLGMTSMIIIILCICIPLSITEPKKDTTAHGASCSTFSDFNATLCRRFRPEPDIVAAFETLDQEMIIPSDAENLEDALIAAKNRLHSIQPSMDSDNLDKFANEISIDQIQVGMSDTYSETFKSMFRIATDPVLTALITAITMLQEPLSPVDLASLLGVDLKQIQYCLSVLQPVLGGHSTNEREPVSFLHKSVVDYLTGAGKSADATSETILSHYAVDPRFTVRKQVGDLLLGSRCLEILNSKLSAQPPLHEAGHFGQYVSPLFQGSRVILSKSFSSRYFGNKYSARALEVGTCSKFFTPDLVHACRFWANYVTLENENELLYLLQSFTESNILHWIEAMIYLQQFDQISPIASSVSVLLMKHGANADKTSLQSIGHMFHDVAVMVQRFSIPLNFHPLQVYDTALTFRHVYRSYAPCTKINAYSRDGKTVACGCADRTLNLFSTVTGKLVQSFCGSVGPILYVAFCPDGDTLITASSDKFVCAWSISGEKRLSAFKTGSFVLRSFAVCPQFDRYAIGTDERVIKLFDLKTHKLVQTVAAGQEQVSRCLAFSPDAKLLVSGSESVVKVFSIETGELVHSFNGHSGTINGIVVLPDNDMIASCSDDKSIRLWSMSTSKCVRVFNDHEDAVNSISVSSNGMMLVCASDDKNIKIFSVPKRKLVKTFTGHNSAAKSVAISPDGFTLASGAADLKVWSVTEKPAQVFEDDHSAAVSVVEFNPAYDVCITGSVDTTVRCWSMNSGRMILSFESHSDAITALAFSAQGDLVASGDQSGRTLVWTLSTGEVVFSVHSNQTPVTSIAFFPDGKKFGCGHAQEPAFVHFLDSKPSKILPKSMGRCFSPDGTKIASVSEDKTVRVFDWAKKTLLHTFAKTATTVGHTASVKSVTFKDNVTLITRDEDGVSFAWSLKGAEKDWKPISAMDVANPRLHHAHLAEDGWIHCLGERLMWIPFELRGVLKARGNHIVLGSGFGVVTIIRVGRDAVPLQRQGHLNV